MPVGASFQIAMIGQDIVKILGNIIVTLLAACVGHPASANRTLSFEGVLAAGEYQRAPVESGMKIPSKIPVEPQYQALVASLAAHVGGPAEKGGCFYKNAQSKDYQFSPIDSGRSFSYDPRSTETTIVKNGGRLALCFHTHVAASIFSGHDIVGDLRDRRSALMSSPAGTYLALLPNDYQDDEKTAKMTALTLTMEGADLGNTASMRSRIYAARGVGIYRLSPDGKNFNILIKPSANIDVLFAQIPNSLRNNVLEYIGEYGVHNMEARLRENNFGKYFNSFLVSATFKNFGDRSKRLSRVASKMLPIGAASFADLFNDKYIGTEIVSIINTTDLNKVYVLVSFLSDGSAKPISGYQIEYNGFSYSVRLLNELNTRRLMDHAALKL